MDGLAASPSKLVYLAGAIEHAPDGGKTWRKELAAWLKEELKLDVYDPCVQEWSLLSPYEKAHLREWKASDTSRFRSIIRRFLDNDLHTLLNATCFVVCLWDEYAGRGAGTAGELTVAYWNKIPVFLVTGLSATEIPGWILACATEIFPNFEQMKHRLLELYGPRVPDSSNSSMSRTGATERSGEDQCNFVLEN